MEQQFAVLAWPDGGFAEMTVAVFDTMQEALEDKIRRTARYPRWRFRIATVTEAE